MTITDFSLLSVEERAAVVKQDGKHLFSDIGNHVSSIFFTMEDFTVEMWIDAGNGQVMGVEPIRRIAA